MKYKFTKNYIKEYGNALPLGLAHRIIHQRDLEFYPATTGGGKMETTGYDHVLYLGERSQEYKEHVDFSNNQEPRTLTCSLILNDDYKGGDFSFFEGEHVIRKKACSAIVFPSNFCFPHAITPVTQGDRHVIITWLR